VKYVLSVLDFEAWLHLSLTFRPSIVTVFGGEFIKMWGSFTTSSESDFLLKISCANA